MVTPPDRSRVGDYPRDATESEWEVFVRDDTGGPLRHVGSITAPDARTAYERATKLFAWYADDVWLCPATAVHRFSTHDLDGDATPTTIRRSGEERAHE